MKRSYWGNGESKIQTSRINTPKASFLRAQQPTSRSFQPSCTSYLESYLERLVAEEATAVIRAAHAALLGGADAVEVVVEVELGAGWNVCDGEQAHASLRVDGPLLSLTVGLATVVHEPAWREGRG